jgi:hypothetical protein
MQETKPIRPSPFRFSLRALLVLTFVFAFCIASCVRIAIDRERSRHLADPQQWPQPIQEILKRSPTVAGSIKVYDLQGFLDETKLVSVTGRQDVVDQLISTFGLVPTNNKHPYATQIFDALPSTWKAPQPSYIWYASQGFGSVHQEGVDLFLIATDPATGDAVILYNWIF